MDKHSKNHSADKARKTSGAAGKEQKGKMNQGSNKNSSDHAEDASKPQKKEGGMGSR
ncbi:MAG: hypothetical protein ABIN48_13115 [Ginsengibacter sp.]